MAEHLSHLARISIILVGNVVQLLGILFRVSNSSAYCNAWGMTPKFHVWLDDPPPPIHEENVFVCALSVHPSLFIMPVHIFKSLCDLFGYPCLP